MTAMKKILLVEDDVISLELMLELLEDDYHLVTASDGVQAVEQASREQPDLILMDMSLPLVDGREATRRIKADPQLKAIPVIGLSAHAMSGDAEKALAAGCDGYLTKPVNFDLLFETLARYLD